VAERPPELIEPIGDTGVGTAWRARRADGTPVIATRVPMTDPGAREEALERLRRLARIDAPTLAPVLGWWADTEAVWFVLEAEEGTSLPDLPNAGYLSPLQASAVSLSVLEGLRALNGESMGHGNLTSPNVRVMPDGRVRLTGHHLAILSPPTQGERAAELRRAGRIMCEAFGVPVERNPREAPRAVEHAAPALVQTVRTVAAGGTGADPAQAIDGLRETAGPLTRPERLEIGREELAALVGARRAGAHPSTDIRFKGLTSPLPTADAEAVPAPAPETARSAPPAEVSQPPPPPAPAKEPARPASPSRPAYDRPAPAPQPVPVRRGPAAAPVVAAELADEPPAWSERRVRPLPHEYMAAEPWWGRLPLVAIAALVLLVVVGGGFFVVRTLGSESPSGVKRSSAPARPTAQPSSGSATNPASSPVPAPVPTFAPLSAGSIQGIDAAATTSCAPGQTCTFNVKVHMTPAHQTHTVTWAFKLFDTCTYGQQDAPGGTINADGSWNLTDGNTSVAVPASKGQVAVVAIAQNLGDTAASRPIMVGSASDCR
jgi:hypothetical protein